MLTSTGCSLFLDLEGGKTCDVHADCDSNLYCSDLITGTGTGEGCIERDDCNLHTDCEGNSYCSSLDDEFPNVCVPASCGNGVVEPGETCDGDCATDCWDGTACTQDTLTGSADTCDVVCNNTPLADGQCIAGDGCCPGGCTIETDTDCESICGDGFVGPGETCEGDACPTADSCNDTETCTEEIF